ncbi:MAG TPA: histidine phosphatase family protein [Dehalococcoidia bacterium]|nr:histidine phosphatase family protein [Dehalococcoidia bacterium]
MTRLLLVRHGESQGNAEHRLQGTVPYPLTELGRKQGEALAERVAAEGADVLYTSPTLRARETGEIIAQRIGLRLDVLEGVREYNFGVLSGLTMAEIAQRHPAWVHALREGGPVPLAEGEEGHESFRERVVSSLWGLVDKHPEDVVAVVTHSGVISVFCQDVSGARSMQAINVFGTENCSLTVVDALPPSALPPGMPRGVIVAFNDVCHTRAS